jgi:hypothetical protein
MATWLGVSGWAVERAGQLVERKRLVASVLLRARQEISESTFERVVYGFTTDLAYHMLWL